MEKIQLKDSLQVRTRTTHVCTTTALLQFMKCALDKLPSILGLANVEKGFFAWRLANGEPALDYRGKIPPAHMFGIEKMMADKQKLFWEWYTPLEGDPNFVYDLKMEAIKYCE